MLEVQAYTQETNTLVGQPRRLRRETLSCVRRVHMFRRRLRVVWLCWCSWGGVIDMHILPPMRSGPSLGINAGPVADESTTTQGVELRGQCKSRRQVS